MAAFEEMGVLPEISKALEEMDWTLPTDVQAEAIPLILGGGDVLMAAETGSGKTGAFSIPVLQIVWETAKDLLSGKTRKSTSSSQSPIWSLSVHDRSNALSITSDGLRCQSREQREWHGCRATKGVKGPGLYYYETIINDEGLCRVGWSNSQAAVDLGTDKFGWGFGGTGKKSNSKQFDNYGEPFGKSDVIGCLLDLNQGEIRFWKNGIDLGTAFKLNHQQKSEAFFPAVVVKNAEIAFNFGAQPFKHPPKNGYVAVSAAPANQIISNPNSANTQIRTSDKSVNNKGPKAIIIEPSRELAEQTCSQIEKCNKYIQDPPVSVLLVVGGISIKDQINQLGRGVDIVVGTPGRLEALVQDGYVSLDQCRFYVLDEADGLLKQNYGPMIERLHKAMPKMSSEGNRLQMIVCSATLHAFEVKKMAEKLMHFPTWVDLKGEDAVPETVHHVVVMIDPQKDDSWQRMRRHIQTDGVHLQDSHRAIQTAEAKSEAVKILKGEYCLRAIREHKMDRAIIFCRTKMDCDNLKRFLDGIQDRELSSVCFHGDRKPDERRNNLNKFKREEVRFLICTDVAARGLDISGLPFIINMTLPDEKTNYVHRIGRVGRAERMGLAISLVSSVPEKVWYHGEWCSSRGRNCSNTNLTEQGGCCIWYNEPRLLAEIEDHLNITIQIVDKDLKIPMNEFDGKVVYGEKQLNRGSNYDYHVQEMTPSVVHLQRLEAEAQVTYLKRFHLVA
ncbi:ATP-dependent RNA helicase Ddx1 [Trichogramma pretiosum]|uniref:ATP-dependent RNA helicase Ddx1 n=1 Tax=Trichogramma pretiosum TaxID=7493 RepID=UPI0006C9AB88|nr:ATP-dependent RNA helicase Ddx1 [Trichogramma pretiosum]